MTRASLGELRATGDGVEGEVHLGRRAATLRVRAEGAPLAARREALLVAALAPCMAAGADVEGVGEVDGRLLAALPAIQGLLRARDRSLRRVALPGARALLPPRPAPPGRRVGAFYSGGLDSAYTLVTRREALTDLVFVRGLDVPAGDEARGARFAASARRVAEAFGLGFVEVVTDLRPWLDLRVDWRYVGHRVALAAVAHLLAPAFGRLHIAGDRAWDEPALDPLWGAEDLDLVHAGAEASRLDKARALARHPAALDELRVCWQDPGPGLNCGRCEKCVRTALHLRAAGARSRSLPAPDPAAVRELRLLDHVERAYALENLRALEDAGERELAEALRAALGRPWRAARLLRDLRVRLGRQAWRRALARRR